VNLGSPPQSLSLSQRLKALSREYGWTAVGVYLSLSVLDFPFCFLAVRALGAERVGRWEQIAVDKAWAILSVPFPGLAKKPESVGDIAEDAPERESGLVTAVNDHNGEETASMFDTSIIFAPEYKLITFVVGIWTQLALAYAVHKSFIFIRVPLTAAILPSVVKQLRRWGWNVGRRALSK
jgi:N-terminal acetyltransferase 2